MNSYNLDSKKTMLFFKKQIYCTNSLSNAIFRFMQINEGQFFTFLPENAHIEKLYNFEEGGIIPENKVITDEGIKIKIVTTKPYLEKFIRNYLNKRDSGCMVVDSLNEKPTDPHLGMTNCFLLSKENEIYYVLDRKNTIDEISEAIEKTCLIWHSLICLFSGTTIDQISACKSFSSILDFLELVILQSYDRESYIIWEKKGINFLKTS